MKILSLTWGFSLGGIGKCLLIYHRLSETPGFDIHTVCIQRDYEDHSLKSLEDIGATIIRIKNRRDLSWIKKCSSLIDKYKPDLLFVHGFNGPIIARVLQFNRKHKLPFVCSYHGKYHAPTKLKKILEPFYNFAQIYLYKKCALAVVVVADYCKKHLISRGVKPDKISVVHNGINSSEPITQRPIPRRKYGVRNDDIIIGTLSRLDPVKGVRFLIDGFSKVIRNSPKTHLFIVGEGVSRNSLQRKCKHLGLADNIHFVGYQSNVTDWLNFFDIFILPSLSEYHSIALLESMRAAKPIIATDVGGNTESVRDGKEALIIPPSDSILLEAALTKLIENTDLRHRLSSTAKERFEQKFTEQQMLENMANWFNSLDYNNHPI